MRCFFINKEQSILSLIAGIWLIYESGYGLLQILGMVHPGHVLFPMTGHFQNPGPFGGFIAMLISICLGYLLITEGNDSQQRWVKRVCFVAVAMGIIVLPASLSRAGWLGLAVAMMVLAFREKKVIEWFSVNPIRRMAVMAAIVIIGVVGFLLKKDSALGRIHVWHMELLAISKATFTGFGRGRFAWVYGETQADYFSTAERASWEIRVAGCPEYAFNEYLKVGVEWGIPGSLMLIGLSIFVCIILVRKANPMGYGAIVFSVFAFYSYPMSLWQFKLWAGLFFAAALDEILGRYGWVSYGVFLLAAGLVWSADINRISKPDYRDLYRQGHALFQMSEYEKALPILQEGAMLSCDPMFHNVMGRCHEALGNDKEAVKEYIHAHHMVPCRLYPLVLLQELYLSQGDTIRAGAILTQIKKMPINPKSSNMTSLLERAINNG